MLRYFPATIVILIRDTKKCQLLVKMSCKRNFCPQYMRRLKQKILVLPVENKNKKYDYAQML